MTWPPYAITTTADVGCWRVFYPPPVAGVGSRQNAADRRMVTLEEPSDRVQGLTLTPALPHQRLIGFGVLDPPPVLHMQHPPLYDESLGVASTS